MSHVNETEQNFLSSSVQIISKKYRVYFLYYSLGSREAFGTLPYCCARFSLSHSLEIDALMQLL